MRDNVSGENMRMEIKENKTGSNRMARASFMILLILILSMLIPITVSTNSAAQALDSDGDGLSDADEIKYHTDKNDADSDDDGVLDGDEIDWNKNTDGKGDINALDHDSDDDGIYDGTEMGITIYDLGNDTDENAKHFRPDEDPETTTSMVKWDTDGDHLSDGEEDKNRNGKYEKNLNETDPNFPDFDGDGLADNDPEEMDIDNDGMYNDFELLFELDPYDPSDALDDPDGDGFTNLREYLGDDNEPGNTDWSDPNDPTKKPDLAPIVKFSMNKIIEEANQTITFDDKLFNVSDRDKDWQSGLKFTWIYGDGNTAKETIYDRSKYKHRYAYKHPGAYTLTLRVEDDNNHIGEDTIQVAITVPIGETTSVYIIEQNDNDFEDKRTIRRNGWIAYKLEGVKVNEKITIRFEVLDIDESVGVRIFVIPAKNLVVYETNDPGDKTISSDYNEYWQGHLSSNTRDGVIRIEVEEEDDILVIFDNNYYQEYSDTIAVVDTPIECKVQINREKTLTSPILKLDLTGTFFLIIATIIAIILVTLLILRSYILKSKKHRGPRPSSDNEILEHVRNQVLEGVPVSEMEYSYSEISGMLDRKYQSGQMSDQTYNLIRSEILCNEDPKIGRAQPTFQNQLELREKV
jgi:hypothetical protein